MGGENSVLLLPGYFILAESNILEGKLKKAEEFLIAAYWNFLKFNKPEEKKENVSNDDISEEYIYIYIYIYIQKLIFTANMWVIEVHCIKRSLNYFWPR